MKVSGQLHAPAALAPGKDPRFPMVGRLGGPQSRSGIGGKDKKPISCPVGNRTSVVHPVA